MGVLLVHAATHAGVFSFHVFCMEDCDMEQRVNPYVDMLTSEYKFLKVELEKEVNRFELIRKQHNMRTRDLTDSITRKWFEVQRAKQEANRERA